MVIFILENLKQKWLVNYTSVAQFQWINSKFGNCTLFKIEVYSAIFLQDIYGMYLLIINYIVPEPKLSLISMLMASSAYIYQLDLKSFVSAWFYDVPAKNVVFSTFFFFTGAILFNFDLLSCRKFRGGRQSADLLCMYRLAIKPGP